MKDSTVRLKVLLISFCLLVAGISAHSATFTTVASGAWNSGATWGNAGNTPGVDFPSVGDIATISGFTVTITSFSASAASITITNNAASILTIASTGSLTFTGTLTTGGALGSNGDLNVNGLLVVEQGATMANTTSNKLLIGATGTYRHNYTTSAGTIYNAGWAAGATLEIFGYTTNTGTPSVGSNIFDNVTWNCANQQTDIYLTGNIFASINGHFTVASTGTNFGPFIFGFNPASDRILTFNKDLILSPDVFFDLNFGATNTTINLKGNLSIGSDDALAHQGSGVATINFNGVSPQIVTSTALLNTVVNFSVDVASTVVFQDENFFSGPGDLVVNGTLSLGSLDPAGAFQVATGLGNIQNIGSQTFNPGSTIIYSGTSAQFLGNGHPSGAGIKTEISNTNGVTLAANATIGGDLELIDLASPSNLSISNRTLTLNGNFIPNDNFLNVLATSSLVINGTGDFGTLVVAGSTTINNFTIDRPSAGFVTLGSNLTIGGTFTQTVGDIVLGGQTLTISGPYIRANGNINGDAAASLIVNGSGALPALVQFAGTQALNTLTVNRSSSTFATSSTLTLTNLNLLSGTFNNGGTITMNDGGVLTRTEGSILSNKPTTSPTTNAYNVVYDIANDILSGAEIPALTTQLRNVTKTGGAALTLTEPLTINGVLTLTNGNFNASTFPIDLKGNFVANSTSTLTSSPFTFSGTTSISGGSIVQFGAVNITGSLTPTINIRIDGNLVNNGTLIAGTGSQAVTFGGTTTISGGSVHNFNAVTVAGNLTAPSSMNVAGDFTFSSGTFTSSNGTVVFNGTSSISGAPSFHNVTVTGTLNGPTDLNITGDLSLNGVFNSGSGRITFNGTGNQKIDRTSGSATTINLFDVTVDKANGTFSIASTVGNTIFRVQNEFTIAQAGANNPDIDFDGPSGAGTLVLASSSTRTAKITAVPAGTQILGNLTVERFVQNADGIRNWRYLSSPVVGATVADWQGEIQITGQFSNPSTGAGITKPNNPSLYRYTETLGGLFNARYERWPNNISLPASSFALENGRGYSVFVRDTGTPTINVRGTLRSGDVGIGLTSTGSEPDAAGFNLVGNPYPAPINWDLVTLPGGVSSTISMIDNVSNGNLGGGQFVYYVQGGPNVGTFTGDIGSGQAFWVETNTATTLTFSESHKSSDINPVIVREKQIANLLRIRVEGNGKKDETVVYFKDKATDKYDLKYDAKKRENEFINLFTHIDGDQGLDKYAINGLQGIDCSREIRLGIEKFTEGTYTFLFSEMESFDNGYQFRLIDNFAGTSVSVNDQAYVFTVTNNPASYGFERFKVIISEGAIESNLAVLGDKKCDSKNLQITLGTSQEGISYQPFYNGAVVGDPMIGNGNSLTLALKEDVFAPGLAEVSVKAFNACGELFLDQKASIEVAEFEDAAIDTQGNTLVSNYPNGNQWFVDGVEIPGANGQSLEATKSGTYTLVVTTGECSTSAERSFVITGTETFLSGSVRVYPNTFKQKFNVEVESSAPVHARVFSTMGVLVAEQQLNGFDTLKSCEFDLTGTSDGMYILYIHKGNTVHQVKIIKSAE